MHDRPYSCPRRGPHRQACSSRLGLGEILFAGGVPGVRLAARPLARECRGRLSSYAMRLAGFEPATNGLEGRRSSTELQARARKRSAGESPINAAAADMPCSSCSSARPRPRPGPQLMRQATSPREQYCSDATAPRSRARRGGMPDAPGLEPPTAAASRLGRLSDLVRTAADRPWRSGGRPVRDDRSGPAARHYLLVGALALARLLPV